MSEDQNDDSIPDIGAPPPPPPPIPRPVQPLAYGRDEVRAPRTPFFVRMMIGFFGFVLATVLWFWLGSMVFRDAGTLWAGWVFMTAALLGLALYLRLRFRFSGAGYGIAGALLFAGVLILGLVILVIGYCATHKVL